MSDNVEENIMIDDTNECYSVDCRRGSKDHLSGIIRRHGVPAVISVTGGLTPVPPESTFLGYIITTIGMFTVQNAY